MNFYVSDICCTKLKFSLHCNISALPVTGLEAGVEELGPEPLRHVLDLGVGEPLAGEGALQGGVGGVLGPPGHAVVRRALRRDGDGLEESISDCFRPALQT